MAEPDLDLIVQETIKTMGKCIKKPPMTDKLLRKPPFRFLHDVITEVRSLCILMSHLCAAVRLARRSPRYQVIKTTGFLAGLYTEPEMVSPQELPGFSAVCSPSCCLNHFTELGKRYREAGQNRVPSESN